MANLIDIKNPEWLRDEELRDQLRSYDSDADLRLAAAPGNLADIEMLTVSSYIPGEALRYPNLKLIQKTGAGVNNILVDEQLPDAVQVARLEAATSGNEMAEFALAYVLQKQRHLREYHAQQAESRWLAHAPRDSSQTEVAILGMGRIGQIIAQRFIDNHFRVSGWSRSAKQVTGVECESGDEGLTKLLARADYIVCVLPSTPQTRGFICREIFEQFNPGALLINMGRGDLVNEGELIQALDDGLLAGAVLDVLCEEPLPAQSPLWLHPGIQITPHVSGYHLGDAIAGIAENYRRLRSGEPLLNLVDRQKGY